LSRLDPSAIQVVAWDFDGVLNRNIENGVFAWSRHFERDLGLCVRSFSAHLFGGRFQKAMVGEACLIDIVTLSSTAPRAARTRFSITGSAPTRCPIPVRWPSPAP
jgi:putative hydrolase of the HAD superfamily